MIFLLEKSLKREIDNLLILMEMTMDKCECGCATTVYGPLVRLDPETKIWLTAGRLMIFGFFGLPGSTLVGMPIFITTHEFQVLYTTREEIIEILKNDSNFGLSGDDSLIYTGFGDPFNTGNDYLDQMQDRLDKFLNSFPNIEDLCACGEHGSASDRVSYAPLDEWGRG